MRKLSVNEVGEVGRGQFLKKLKNHIMDFEFYTKEKILMYFKLEIPCDFTCTLRKMGVQFVETILKWKKGVVKRIKYFSYSRFE